MKKISLACLSLLIVSGCSMHHSASAIRPEYLINSSAEKISFPIVDSSSLPAIENWISSGDLPSGAEISCADSGNACLSVKKMLKNRKINFNEVASASDSNTGNVSLTYNRVIARECTTNNFGCATSLNSIHMVTNREQFVKPALSDYQDADSAVKALGKHSK